jgi:hypothetical protein
VPVELVCAPARLYRPGDGDSFRLLVNFRRRGTWDHAQVVDIRLRGYRARESYDKAPEDPFGAGRVDGPTATRIVTDLLTRAELVLVEFTGANDRGREVCDVWLRLPGETGPPELLGRRLLALNAVIPGSTIGTAE